MRFMRWIGCEPLKEKLGSYQLEAGRPRGLRLLSFAKISKKLTSKVQRTSYAKVPKGTVADIRLECHMIFLNFPLLFVIQSSIFY